MYIDEILYSLGQSGLEFLEFMTYFPSGL